MYDVMNKRGVDISLVNATESLTACVAYVLFHFQSRSKIIVIQGLILSNHDIFLIVNVHPWARISQEFQAQGTYNGIAYFTEAHMDNRESRKFNSLFCRL